MSALICISKISNACESVYVCVGTRFHMQCTQSAKNQHLHFAPSQFGIDEFPCHSRNRNRNKNKNNSSKNWIRISTWIYFSTALCAPPSSCVPTTRCRIHWLAFFAMCLCIWFAFVYKQICTYFTCDFLFYQSKPHTQISRRTQTHTHTHTFTKPKLNQSDRLHLSDFRFTHKKWIRIEMVFVFFPASFSFDSHGYAYEKTDFSHSLYQQHRARQRVYVKYAVVESFSHFPSRFVFHSTSHSILFFYPEWHAIQTKYYRFFWTHKSHNFDWDGDILKPSNLPERWTESSAKITDRSDPFRKWIANLDG